MGAVDIEDQMLIIDANSQFHTPRKDMDRFSAISTIRAKDNSHP